MEGKIQHHHIEWGLIYESGVLLRKQNTESEHKQKQLKQNTCCPGLKHDTTLGILMIRLEFKQL